MLLRAERRVTALTCPRVQRAAAVPEALKKEVQGLARKVSNPDPDPDRDSAEAESEPGTCLSSID